MLILLFLSIFLFHDSTFVLATASKDDGNQRRLTSDGFFKWLYGMISYKEDAQPSEVATVSIANDITSEVGKNGYCCELIDDNDGDYSLKRKNEHSTVFVHYLCGCYSDMIDGCRYHYNQNLGCIHNSVIGKNQIMLL